MADLSSPRGNVGLLVPDARLTFSPDDSGEYTVAGARLGPLISASPIAGIPSPQQTTLMALRASGEQSADIEAHTNRAGLPVTDEAGLLWKLDTDADSELRGCDLAVPLKPWEVLEPVSQYRHPHVVTMGDGAIVECQWNTGAGIEVRVRDPSTHTWAGAVSVHAVLTYCPHPCLMVLPIRDDVERLHLYYWHEIGSEWQIGLYYSDDAGATWTWGGVVLYETLSATTYADLGDEDLPHRLRAAYLNGQVLMLANLRAADTNAVIWRDRLIQWASSDGGGLFTQIVLQDGSDEDNMGYLPDIAVLNGQFIVGYLRYETAVTQTGAAFVRLSSAWTPITAPEESSLTATALMGAGHPWSAFTGNPIAVPPNPDIWLHQGNLALWADDDGSLYCSGRHQSGADAGACVILRSVDAADSWTRTGRSNNGWTGTGQWWYNNSTINYAPNEFAASAQRGRSIMVHGWDDAGTVTGKIGVGYLGGWQNVPMPTRYSMLDPTDRIAWDRTGSGMHLPDNGGWTLTPAGAPAIALVNARIHVTCGAGDTVNYTYACAAWPGTVTLPEGVIAEWECTTIAGTPLYEIRVSDATPLEYRASIRVSTTQVVLYDEIGAAVIATATPSVMPRIRIRLQVRGAYCKGWYALSGTTEDTVWTEIGTTNALVSNAADPGERVRMGIGNNEECYIDEYHFSPGEYCGDGWAAQDITTKFPRSLQTTPVWYGRGVKLSSSTGPTIHGDSWTIDGTYEYPPQSLLPRLSPSPRHPWRSRTITDMEAGTEVIRITFNVDSGDASTLGHVLGAWLQDVNCSAIQLAFRAGGGWAIAGTTATDDVTMDRYSKTLVTDTAGTGGSHTWRRDELAEAGAEFITGAPPDNSVNRVKIKHNTPGVNRIGGTSQTLKCELYDVPGGAAANPLVRLWPRRHLLVAHTVDTGEVIEKVQLRIPVDLTAPYNIPGPPVDGYLEIGVFAFGACWLWGWGYGHGRRIDHEANIELITAEDGTRMARELGPPRRVVEIAWPDGVPMQEYLTDSYPDYVVGKSGGSPAAMRRNIPHDMGDQLRAIQGGLVPVVYLPYLPKDTAGGFIGWGQGAVYGRITQTVSIDNVRGDELVSEVSRVQSVTIEEEQ